MCRLRTLMVISAAQWVISSPSQAAGSYQKQPMFDHLIIAGVPHPARDPSLTPADQPRSVTRRMRPGAHS